MVPKTGVEPVRSCLRGILSPLRLPIPPLWHTKTHNYSASILTIVNISYNCQMEAPPRFELGIKVLQTSALPLGDGAT